MTKRITLAVLGFLVLAALLFLLVAWHSAMPKITPPEAGAFSQSEIDRGKVLAGLGDCAVCHTSSQDRPYAGGYPLPTAFGTIYSANITPDPSRGIGSWSEEAFARALRQGISRDGSYLYPAFPYTHFTKLSDADIQALYAYVMTRKPLNDTPPANTLRWPFSIRMLQAGWQMLFFDDGRYQPVVEQNAQWNRGAYLASGLGHCSACHTPRNALGAENADQVYDGASIDNWYAPALNAANATPVTWTLTEIYTYLRNGGSRYHGVAAGSMAPVVHEGLSAASDRDIQALATFFSSLNGGANNTDSAAAAKAAINAAHASAGSELSRGEQIYAAACAGCHYNQAHNPQALRPALSLNSAVHAPTPDNLIRITLQGVSLEDGLPDVLMPGFGQAFSDEDIASLVSFLRRSQTHQPAWNDVQQRVHSLRP